MIRKIQSILISVTAFVVPLIFLNTTSNRFETNKLAFLAISTTLLLILYTIDAIRAKTLRLVLTPFHFPAILFFLSLSISLLVASPNKIEAFIGEISPILFSLIFFCLATNMISTAYKLQNLIVKSLLVATSLICATSLAQLLFNPYFPSSYNSASNFTPAGSQTNLAFLGLLGVVIAITQAIKAIKTHQSIKKYIIIPSLGLLIALHLFAVFMAFSKLTENSKTLNSVSTSWNILTSVLQNSPLLGSGPGTYKMAYDKFRPLSTNTDELWGIRHLAAQNSLFHFGTIAGLLGLLSYLFLIYSLVKTLLPALSDIKKNPVPGLPLLVLLSLVGNFFIPTGTVSFFILFLLLALASGHVTSSHTELSLNYKSFRLASPGVLSLLAIVSIFSYFALWGTYRVYGAEVYLKKSLDILSRGEGLEGFKMLTIAISLNPKIDSYHTTASNISYLLADAIIKNKKDLTEEDRQDVSKLIQNSIDEGKIAVSLNPRQSRNWYQLALTYSRIINIAPDASNWATTALTQTIALDPLDPQLHFELGSLFFNLEQLDEAKAAFERAVALKPNFANAHFNLAAVLKKLNQIDRAISEYEIILTLIEPDSADWKGVTEDLAKLKLQRPAKVPPSPAESVQLSLPTPFPTPLPTSAVKQISPTATPKPSPLPSP